MKITLRTKNGATLTAFERKVVKLASLFYANKLMTPRMVDSIELVINVHNDYHKRTGYLGDVMPVDDEITNRPKKFEINLDWPKRFKRMLISLGHEMVHVKQYVDGRLEHGSSGIWLGTMCEDKYEDLPWEIEAYELEQKMIDAFYC